MKQDSAESMWQALQAQAETLQTQRLEALFAADARRVEQLSVAATGLYLDCSKQRWTPAVVRSLRRLAGGCGLAEHRRALFAGDSVNTTEQRAAWHVALRAPGTAAWASAEVHAVQEAMRGFVRDVRSGTWQGHDGRAIRDVVNLGIGGSDLGPRLVCRALAAPRAQPRVHFVANIDPHDLDDVLAMLDPATTLFVVTSKSFASAETMANAAAARQWLRAAGVTADDLARHMVAVSANREAVASFGITHMFEFWDWVGGRYSLWSAVGLAIALALGMDAFDQLLAGAHAMDNHFLEAPLAHNLPVMLALAGVWNRNFLGLPGHVVVPYAQRLVHFPEWLQQLEMESNGKGVTRAGEAVSCATVPMVWGTVGTNAQHAYFQMLHQAALTADIDFILPLPDENLAGDERADQCVANCLAQAEALMCGSQSPATDRSSTPRQRRLAAAQHCAGNRPSSMLLMRRLDAWHLGALLAAYEHKVFVQGTIWNINSFDQWGVQLGKTLAGRLLRELQAPASSTRHDASTQTLLERVRRIDSHQ